MSKSLCDSKWEESGGVTGGDNSGGYMIVDTYTHVCLVGVRGVNISDSLIRGKGVENDWCCLADW